MGRKRTGVALELLARVAAEARKDPARVGPVLQVFVGGKPASPGGLRVVAARLNAAAHDEFRAGSLTADEEMPLRVSGRPGGDAGDQPPVG